jgi:small conductance mechanosensitive channel
MVFFDGGSGLVRRVGGCDGAVALTAGAAIPHRGDIPPPGNRPQPFRAAPPWAPMAWYNDAMQWIDTLPPLGQRLVLMAVTLLVGYVIILILQRYSERALERSKRIDTTLRGFLVRLLTIAAVTVLVVVLLAQAGVNLTALLGGLAIGGFVVGFALKDALGNLAAGVMLLFYRPFSIDDTVSIAGNDGQVLALGMALTVLKAADGRLITIPNGKVLGGAVINHTREPIRRADVLVGIHYDDDIDTAVRAIIAALQEDPRVLAEPAPDVRITGLGDSSVDLQVRPWVNTVDFWKAKAELNGTVKRAIEAAGCTIPFPQRDVHMYPEGAQ